jgi:D-amino-acid dehydrogenase
MRIRWSQLLQSTPWLYRFWRAGKSERVKEIVDAQVSLMNSVQADFDTILAETSGEFLRESRGLILLYDSENDFNNDAWKYEARKRLDFPWTRLTHDELRSMEPHLRLHNGVAFMEPDWQHVIDPGGVTRWFADAAFERGVTWIHDRVGAVSASENDVSVTTESGRKVEADWLVIAAGVWSNALIRQFGRKAPMMPKRGYHSMIGKPSLKIHYPIMSASRHVLLTPMRDGLRVSGTAEFAGLDTEPDFRRAKALLHHARHYVPDLEAEEITEWMGQRPMMPDSLPVLGPLPGQGNVLCAFGHGHYGLTQGPTTGRVITSLVFGEEPGVDLAPFSISRF